MARKDSDNQKKSMSAMFRGRAIFKPFTKRYTDPDAPYDGYEEADDTEEAARSVPLTKKKPGRGAAI